MVLTEVLDNPNIDIAATLRGVSSAAEMAVSSYVGLSVQIEMDAGVVTLEAFEDATTYPVVHSSLRASLQLGSDGQPSKASPMVSIVLYASNAGAFVDLAADLSWLTAGLGATDTAHFSSSDIEVDGHLEPLRGHARRVSISDLTVVNQAIGVLIGEGETPEQAERELYLAAARDGVEVTAAGKAVLARIDRTRSDGGPAV
ncbi:hypothetical protein [Jatrophihabitans sp.]|uniref:hypothetical protein n=1 Tax=Jatrophihabitans sp. TaxID=1932789 RepID=UPI0030C7662B